MLAKTHVNRTLLTLRQVRDSQIWIRLGGRAVSSAKMQAERLMSSLLLSSEAHWIMTNFEVFLVPVVKVLCRNVVLLNNRSELRRISLFSRQKRSITSN